MAGNSKDSRLGVVAASVLAAAIMGAAPRPLAGQGSGLAIMDRRLQLDEIGVVTLPSGMPVLGGVLNSDGEVVFWTTTQVWQVRGTKRALKLACRGMSLRPRVGIRGKDGVGAIVFDSTSRSLIRVDRSGRCRRDHRITFDTTESIIAGSGNRWLQFETPNRAAPVAHMVSSSGTRVQTLDAGTGWRLPSARYLLANHDASGAILVETQFPFRVFRFTERSGAKLIFDPTLVLSASERRRLEGWTALVPISLGDRILETIADPTSDERRLIVFSRAGRGAHQAMIRVAMGFLDADPQRRIVLALRNVGVPELVTYHWSWRAP